MSESVPRIIRRNIATLIAEAQCNCACGEISLIPSFTDSRPIVGPIHRHPALRSIPLDSQYRAAFIPSVSEIVVLNQAAWDLLSFFDSPQPVASIPVCWHTQFGGTLSQILDDFIALGFLVNGVNGQVQTYLSEPDTLIAWLHITDACNLRCVYCYLPHTRTAMSPAVGRAAIDATIRSALAHDYRKIKLKYAGGEPLLNFPLVVDLHSYARQLADRHHLALDGVVLSNATLLTPGMVETMLSLGLQLMISLDGLGDFHDQQRPYAEGRSSAADVTHAVDLALSHGLVPDISITITGRNANGLSELIEWVLERDLSFSLNFYRENNFSSSETDLLLEEDRTITGMLASYRTIESNLPFRSLLASLVDRVNLAAPHLHTCTVGHNYLVFDCQGRIAKCQMDIGNIVAGIHDPDPLARVRESTDGVQNPLVDEKEGCKNCPWRYWCTGGCPLEAYRITGHCDVKSPNCNIYRALCPEVIRLEGLRLLKTQS